MQCIELKMRYLNVNISIKYKEPEPSIGRRIKSAGIHVAGSHVVKSMHCNFLLRLESRHMPLDASNEMDISRDVN